MQTISLFIKKLSLMTSLSHNKSSLRSSKEYEIEQCGYQLGNPLGQGSYAKVPIALVNI